MEDDDIETDLFNEVMEGIGTALLAVFVLASAVAGVLWLR